MSWIRRRPRDVIEQLLEYAESGRLAPLAQLDDRRHGRRNPLTLFVIVASLVSAGFGVAFAFLLRGESSAVLVVSALLLAVLGIGILVAAAGAIHDRATTRDALRAKPGAVLPPDLVRVGNWIHRGGAWVRVEEIGRDGGGRVSALLSTGEVVQLDTAVTIAGGPFRPVADPVESLRR